MSGELLTKGTTMTYDSVLGDITEAAASLRRVALEVQRRTATALSLMDQGMLPDSGGIGGAGFLGHQTPSDLTIANVRLDCALKAARAAGRDSDQINAAYLEGARA